MQKELWIVANWKSNKTIIEALEWVSIVGPNLQIRENIKIVVCPTFNCLTELNKEIQTHNYPVALGSQDLSPFGIGAFTGEEAAELLKDLIGFSIIGHSERRTNFSETDDMVTKKVQQAKEHEIIPLVCVQGPDVPVPEGCNIVAYEPVWAIGTGTPDTPENAQKVAAEVKSRIPNINVLYGGSVTSENCVSFIKQPDISGLLIGKASLDMEEFLKIVENCGTV